MPFKLIDSFLSAAVVEDNAYEEKYNTAKWKTLKTRDLLTCREWPWW